MSGLDCDKILAGIPRAISFNGEMPPRGAVADRVRAVELFRPTMRYAAV
jgi:hypothetical protein